MSERAQYRGKNLSHAVLLQRREEAEAHRRTALVQVDGLAGTQRELRQGLAEDVSALEAQQGALRDVQRSESDTGLLAVLTRPLTSRRNAVARRSISEGLNEQYQHVSVRLREASQFSDELELCSLELQRELDRLHRDLADAIHNQRIAAERITVARDDLDAIEADATITEAERDRLRDRFTFDLRSEEINQHLHQAAAEQCEQHVEPARALRDTVLSLREQMAAYVLQASHTVAASGRRLQALGMLGDAPTVVAELQESIDELHAAMEATQHYIDQSQRFLSHVLPDLRNRIEGAAEKEATELTGRLENLKEAGARHAADKAMREAAIDEVERHLAGEDG